MGSPPLMRGKVGCYRLSNANRRITPAHAGKSKNFIRHTFTNKDHPRSCGEKMCPQQHSVLRAGSPPLMRGKVNLRPKLQSIKGITPAHAGKSYRLSENHGSDKDHPRSCGEKSFPKIK